MAKVTMPQLGESVAEGTIGKWLKQPGDPVSKDEPLLEVITDKVNAEVPSPFAGILREILVAEGDTVPYNAEIAVIEEDGAAAPRGAGTAAAKAAAPVAPAEAPRPAATPATPATPQPPPAATPATPATPQPPAMVPVMAAGDPDARMTPAVRMLMRQHGLSPVQILGTGHAGRITRQDVLAFVARGGAGTGSATGRGGVTAVGFATQPGAATAAAADVPSAWAAVSPSAGQAPVSGVASHSPGLAQAAPSSPAPVVWAPGQDEVLIPHNQMRRGIAAQMTRAAAIPVAHSTFEADMTAVVNLRARQAEAYKAREGVGLSFLPFVVKAVVEALHAHPDINAHYTDEGLLRKRHINIGIAIAVENGLIVPVIHDADQLSINGINRAIQDLASRARSNKLRLDDIQGGTFTIDNTGWFGSILTVPIINPPEVCILTTEAVVKRPVVHETPEGDVLAIRSMMNLVAGYDHRATDGAQIGRFIRDVICWLEAVGPDSPIY
ncbi:MAG: dihydrolipoamide acetyltransferase family protein [Candidatus Limnocylindrales bacterium]